MVEVKLRLDGELLNVPLVGILKQSSLGCSV